MATSSHLIVLLAMVAAVADALPHAPAAPASDIEVLTKYVCGGECNEKTGDCHPGRYMIKVKDATALWSCAQKNGVHLPVTDDPEAAINDLLRVVGFTSSASKAIRNCFYAHLGLLRDGIVDVEAVKTMLQLNVNDVITVPSQRAAILRAVDTCPLPSGDSMRNFGVCLARTCISILNNV